VVTTYYTPETRGRDLDDLRDAAEVAAALHEEQALRPS
jgi:MHS family metabolite:H+ symporter-like MFS transporter